MGNSQLVSLYEDYNNSDLLIPLKHLYNSIPNFLEGIDYNINRNHKRELLLFHVMPFELVIMLNLYACDREIDKLRSTYDVIKNLRLLEGKSISSNNFPK